MHRGSRVKILPVFSMIIANGVLATAAQAEECLAIDSKASEIGFEVLQAGMPVRGRFERIGGEVCLENETVMRIDAWIAPASAVTGVADIDATLKQDAFFAVEKFPRAGFSTDRIETADGESVVYGRLHVKEVERELAVPFRMQKSADVYTARGRFEISRLDFGIGTGEWSDTEWLAENVTVTFSLHASK